MPDEKQIFLIKILIFLPEMWFCQNVYFATDLKILEKIILFWLNNFKYKAKDCMANLITLIQSARLFRPVFQTHFYVIAIRRF